MMIVSLALPRLRPARGHVRDRIGANPRRHDRRAGAARQRHGVGRSGADRRRHRQCRLGGADRDLSRAGSRHHRRDAGGPGADRVARASGDRRRHPQSQEISITRLARTLESKDIEAAIARALEHKNGLGDAANLSLTFDRDVQDLRLEASNTGAMQAVSTRFDSRSNRFDVTFEIANEQHGRPDQAALHRHRDRDRRSRHAGARRRAQRSDQILRRGDRAPPQGRGRQRPRRPRPRGRHAGPQAAARRPGAEDRRSRQARSGAEGPGRRPDLPGGRTASHHSRQGAGGRHRRRRRQRDEPAVQAHRVRRRHRPRPGLDHRSAAPRLPEVSDATSSIGSSQAATLVAIANAASTVSPKAE